MPAPTWRMMSNVSLADSSKNTSEQEKRKIPTVASRGRATDDASESKRRGAVAPAPAGADTQSETRTYVPAATTCASCCGPATEKP